VLEGQDLDQGRSYRSTNHIIHFTVNLHGNQRNNFMAAIVPGPTVAGGVKWDDFPLLQLPNPFQRYQENQLSPPWPGNGPYVYTSQWAEVAYFLVIQPSDTANGTPLYSLYRRQRLLVMDPVFLTSPPLVTAQYGSKLAVPVNNLNPPHPQPFTGPAYDYPEVSFSWEPGDFTKPPTPPTNSPSFMSPNDLTVPYRRFGMSNTTIDANTPGVTRAYMAGLIAQQENAPVLRRNPYLAPKNYYTYPTLGNGDIVGPRGPNCCPPTGPLLENSDLLAADLLLTDVLSFDVRFMPIDYNPLGVTPQRNPSNTKSEFIDLYDPNWFHPAAFNVAGLWPRAPYNGDNPCYRARNGDTGPRVFDTWSKSNTLGPPPAAGLSPDYDLYWNKYGHPASPGNPAAVGQAAGMPIYPPLNIRAVQITLRIWDNRTSQSRQITIIQDL